MTLRVPAGRWFLCLRALQLCLAAGLISCAATEPMPSSRRPPGGFLGNFYSQLQPGGAGQPDLRYVNPGVQWRTYDKVLVDPVTFWGSDATKVPLHDQQLLCSYFYEALKTSLAKRMTVVERPGPGVMRVQVALTDAEAAPPTLRAISTLLPQARVANAMKYLATGSYAFVAAAHLEEQVTDAVSGERLAASVDQHLAAGTVAAAPQWQWSDAQPVMDSWAERLAERLAELHAGERHP